jgi:anion-transporting  ArsA/GET3 family ATPase
MSELRGAPNASGEHSMMNEPEEPRTEAGETPGEGAGRGAPHASGRQHVSLSVSPPALDVDRLIDDRRTRVIVCCGSGGVGKTTTAAALGLRAAERGRHVVVLTVDPARRLAQSMGLTSLDNTPRPVPFSERPSADEDAEGPGWAGGGSLHAMMLDMKRTFDEIVEAHADPDRAAQILANPFYQSLSSGFSGTQEYMAMEKLGQLRRADEWDLIVVDTPPSRSALDFLDAPQRLGRFLDGRLIRLLVVPAKVGGRAYLKVLNAGFGMVTGVLTRVLGAQVLRDVQTFVSALDTMFGGFRERADYTYRLLRAPGTAFLVIAAPEPDALREASYFVERLAQEGMPLAGLILNRVHGSPAARLSAARSLAAAETLQAADQGSHGDGRDYPSAEPGPHALAIAALRLHAERMQLTASERRVSEHFTTAHPHVPVAEVPDQADDVHDLAGLRAVGDSFRSR